MSRPPIPAELYRAVLVEAGHRCAIPRCGNTELDVHHITSWATCKKHEYHNLIALCPVCHRRAHKDEIDRKSLQEYKGKLAVDNLRPDTKESSHPAIEVKRCIKEEVFDPPGYLFSFEYPDFDEPRERIVSRNLEAWGEELLITMQDVQDGFDLSPYEGCTPPRSWIKGSYEVVRRDIGLISLKYTIVRFHTGAAHRSQGTRVQNFILSPFTPVTIDNLIIEGQLETLSELVREKLLSSGDRNEEWVRSGTEPKRENFGCFTFQDWGVTFIFGEYQVGCYAEGVAEIFLSYGELEGIVEPNILRAVQENVL